MVSPRGPVRGGGREVRGGFLFELTGGSPCLDFANTVVGRPTPGARERLATYADLASWSRQAGLLTRAEEVRLNREERRHPEKGRAALVRARALRETLFRLFLQVAEGRPEAARLEDLQPLLASAYRAPVLRPFVLGWQDDRTRLDGMLGPIVRSAVALLISPDRDRVRVCASERCDWLFLDASRNRSRQWCDMAVCGNRAKAHRYQRRWRRRRPGDRGLEGGGR